MSIEAITLIIGAIGGLSGLSALIKTVFDYKLQKNQLTTEESLKPVKDSLTKLEDKSHTRDLNDSRTHLLILINHFPHDHQAILREAEHYIIELGGDSWMSDILIEWSEKENVNIDYIMKHHK